MQTTTFLHAAEAFHSTGVSALRFGVSGGRRCGRVQPRQPLSAALWGEQCRTSLSRAKGWAVICRESGGTLQRVKEFLDFCGLGVSVFDHQLGQEVALSGSESWGFRRFDFKKTCVAFNEPRVFGAVKGMTLTNQPRGTLIKRIPMNTSRNSHAVMFFKWLLFESSLLFSTCNQALACDNFLCRASCLIFR